MADIPPLILSSAPANTAVPPAPLTVVDLIAATIQQLPDRIQELARQIQLTGTVTALLDNGELTLRSAAGDVQLQVPTPTAASNDPAALFWQQLTDFSKAQKPLTVLIQPGNPPTQALLLLPQAALAAPNKDIAQTAKPDAPQPALEQLKQPLAAQTLSAHVLPEKLFGGEAMKLPTSIQQNQTTPQPQAKPETPAAEAQKTPTSVAAKDQAAPSPLAAFRPDPALIKPSADLNVKIAQIIPQGSPPPAQLASDEVMATIVGKGPNGQLLANTNQNTIFVRQSVDLPVGTRLVLNVAPAKDDAFTVLELPSDGAQELQAFLSALTRADGAAASNLIAQHVPQPNANMPTTLLFMLSAFAQGDMRSWTADGVRKLDKLGGRELANKLIEALKQNSGIAHDQMAGEWQALTVPLYDASQTQIQHQYQMLHFYIRDDRADHATTDDPKKAERGPKRTRFLINLNLNRLGSLQMDGLVQRKQLDLIIRSEKPLPRALPDELRAAYTTALMAIDYAGHIQFQTGRQNWLNLSQPGPSATPSVSA